MVASATKSCCRQSTLFRQGVLAIHMELSGYTGSSGVGLASPDADRVIPLRDDRIAFLGHHLEIARLQLKMALLACPGFKVDAIESTEGNARRSFQLWE